MSRYLASLAFFFVSSSVMGAPTERPLPMGIHAENANYRVLRDHQSADLFYLVPKRMLPVEQSLVSSGKPEKECEAFEIYQAGQKKLIEERLRLLDAVGSSDQPERLRRIDGLEASLAAFEEKLVQPAATVILSWRLPQTLEEARGELGFFPSEKTIFPDLAGLTLSPDNSERQVLPSSLQKRASLTLYDAQWSVKPREVSTGSFGLSFLPAGMEFSHLPSVLTLRQPLSLFTFCELRKHTVPALPVSVSYVIAEWQDRNPFRPDNWLVYSRRLSEEAWAIIKTMPAEESAIPMESDPGEPRFYDGNGKYQARVFELSILDQTVEKREKE